MVEVVAALIWKEGRFLIAQRPENKARGLLWEFVGGKVEPGESPEQALARECREELGATVIPQEKYLTVEHVYPDLTVRLTIYSAVALTPVKKLEHNDLRWITVREIDGYDFCPADKEILERIKKDLA